MNEAIGRMLARYQPQGPFDYTRALREILQEVALLGLWRSKFFDAAAFYGGTALRVLYGSDRFSEDLDFSLLSPRSDFDLSVYASFLEREIRGFGFDMEMTLKRPLTESAVRSAFLKADTVKALLTVGAASGLVREVPVGKQIRIRLEIDTDPLPGFSTETRFLLQPVPFAVRVYEAPDLFAGKMHALLFRKWKSRVKGRDWYDLVWFAANRPELHLSHLEQRMRQSGHWEGDHRLDCDAFMALLDRAIDSLDVAQARREVEPFVQDAASLELWSSAFFQDVASRILCI